jgi:hypothetical protein
MGLRKEHNCRRILLQEFLTFLASLTLSFSLAAEYDLSNYNVWYIKFVLKWPMLDFYTTNLVLVYLENLIPNYESNMQRTAWDMRK